MHSVKGIPPKGLYRAKEPQGDLPGCIHTRPLIDLVAEFGVTWEQFVDSIRSGEVRALRKNMLIIKGVGPEALGDTLRGIGLAFIGLDDVSADRRFVAVPCQSRAGLVDMQSARAESDAYLVAEKILSRVDLPLGNHTVRAACYDFDPGGVPDLVSASGEALDLHRSAESAREQFVKSGSGAVKPAPGNIMTAINSDPTFENCLRYDDLFKITRVCRPVPWDEGQPYPRSWERSDTLELSKYLLQRHAFSAMPSAIDEVVDTLSKRCAIHPVRDFLKTLRWDGTPRVERWLSTYFGVTESPYSRAVGRMWLISAIARAMEPGCKVDTLLVIEGTQGVHKGQMLRALAEAAKSKPSVFGDTKLIFQNKNAFLQLDGIWIQELQELDLDASENALKAFFTTSSDRYQRPYDRRASDNPRQCVLVGTFNPRSIGSGYFKDLTGNRRYWPVAAHKVEDGVEAMKRDRDQLWAEAFALYRSGVKWWPSAAEETLIENEVRLRVSCEDAWAPLLEEKLLGRGGYLDQDVRLCMSVSDRWDMPYEVLYSGQHVLSFFIQKDTKWVSLSDGERINKVLEYLRYTNKGRNGKQTKVHNLAKERGRDGYPAKQNGYHLWWISEEQERARRMLLAHVFALAEDENVNWYDKPHLTALYESAHDPELGKSWDTLPETLQRAVKEMHEHVNCRDVFAALSAVVGFDVIQAAAEGQAQHDHTTSLADEQGDTDANE